MGEMTAAGRDAVRMRGLFGGETEERATAWVEKIEAEAAAQERARIRAVLVIQADLSGKDVQAMEGADAKISRGHYENDYGDYLRGYRTAALDNIGIIDAGGPHEEV